MARICGICKRAPREGEGMRPVRLSDEDLASFPTVSEVGLYSACVECHDTQAERVAEKLGVDRAKVTNHMLC